MSRAQVRPPPQPQPDQIDRLSSGTCLHTRIRWRVHWVDKDQEARTGACKGEREEWHQSIWTRQRRVHRKGFYFRAHSVCRPGSKQPLIKPFATWRCDVSVIGANIIHMMEQFILQIAAPSDGRVCKACYYWRTSIYALGVTPASMRKGMKKKGRTSSGGQRTIDGSSARVVVLSVARGRKHTEN